jgi:hypothetical protein
LEQIAEEIRGHIDMDDNKKLKWILYHTCSIW